MAWVHSSAGRESPSQHANPPGDLLFLGSPTGPAVDLGARHTESSKAWGMYLRLSQFPVFSNWNHRIDSGNKNNKKKVQPIEKQIMELFFRDLRSLAVKILFTVLYWMETVGRFHTEKGSHSLAESQQHGLSLANLLTVKESYSKCVNSLQVQRSRQGRVRPAKQCRGRHRHPPPGSKRKALPGEWTCWHLPSSSEVFIYFYYLQNILLKVKYNYTIPLLLSFKSSHAPSLLPLEIIDYFKLLLHAHTL